MDGPSPRDTFITVYGRRPVAEVLADPSLEVDKVIVAKGVRAGELAALAEARGVPLQREPQRFVTRLSGSARQAQGVVPDVRAPRMASVAAFAADLAPDAAAKVLVLDGVTNPANV